MDSKYNVLINYLGEGDFKFIIKKIGEVTITRFKPIYLYNADVDTINSLRQLRRMLIEITIGAKPEGAFKVYNLDNYNREIDYLKDPRLVADKRGFEAVTDNEVKSILSSGTNGPIVEEKPVVVEKKTPAKPKSKSTKGVKKNTKKAKK